MRRDDGPLHPRSRRIGGIALSLALAATFAAGQETARGQTRDEARPAADESFGEVVEVRVVNVEVYVTDRGGDPVLGLAEDDFVLKVDGEVTPISNFYAESGGPGRIASAPADSPADSPAARTPSTPPRPLEEVLADPDRGARLVILVDHTRLGGARRKRAFQAVREAVDRLDERAAIAVVGVEPGGTLVFYSDFLSDHRAVHRILDDISRVAVATDVREAERRQIFGELARGESGGILARTSLADEHSTLARIQAYAADEFTRSLGTLRQIQQVITTMAGAPGRKALLYVGEGVPTRPAEGLYVEWRNRFSGTEIGMPNYDFNTDYTRAVGRYELTGPVERLAEAANRAGVTLYSVDAHGDQGGEIRSALTEQGATSEALTAIEENFRAPLESATQATGGRHLRSSGRLADQLVDLFTAFDSFYSLGFVLPPGWEPGSQHDIEVEVAGRGLFVRHREEVILPEADEREAGAMVAALIYHAVDNPLGIRAVPGGTKPGPEGAEILQLQLEIPVGNLELLPQGGTHLARLTIYVAVRDAAGDPGRIQRIPFHLPIPDEKLAEARGESAHYPLPVVVRPGDRQVAIGVRDDTSGAFSAVRLDV